MDLAARVFEFGPFRYDPAQRQLFRDGQPIPLMPKAADTLHVLLEHRGQIIEKGELLKLVWPDTTVEEIGLARNISILRKLLGDEGGTYIETIPKRGYRFVGEAASVTVPEKPRLRNSALVWRLAVASGLLAAVGLFVYVQFYRPSKYLPHGGRLASLAVIPLDSRDAGMGGTLAEDLTGLLAAEIAKLDAVQVMSPSTVARYRTARVPMPVMSRLLGLAMVVEGSVQNVGDQMTVAVRLTDVHSGKVIWAEVYEMGEKGSGLEIAQRVAREIGVCVEKADGS